MRVLGSVRARDGAPAAAMAGFTAVPKTRIVRSARPPLPQTCMDDAGRGALTAGDDIVLQMRRRATACGSIGRKDNRAAPHLHSRPSDTVLHLDSLEGREGVGGYSSGGVASAFNSCGTGPERGNSWTGRMRSGPVEMPPLRLGRLVRPGSIFHTVVTPTKNFVRREGRAAVAEARRCGVTQP